VTDAFNAKKSKPPVVPDEGSRVIYLAKPALATRLGSPGVTVVPVDLHDARRCHAGYVALKGRLFEYFARGLVAQGISLWQEVLKDPSPKAFRVALELGARLG
jgi:hypothetical protein